MKLTLLKDINIVGNVFTTGQQIETNNAVGALMVEQGDAEQLPDDTAGCFVQV